MINVVVEGSSDEGMARTVVRAAGRDVARIIVKRGKGNLDPLMAKYNYASRHALWVVFRDSDAECPVVLRDRLLSSIDDVSPSFLLRLVHPMAEAWLLSDRRGFADYFSVKEARMPADPEALPHPKREVLTLCASSRSRSIRRDVVLPDGRTGPLYTSVINDFASNAWSVQEATTVSDSLRRAVDRIAQMPAPSGRSR